MASARTALLIASVALAGEVVYPGLQRRVGSAATGNFLVLYARNEINLYRFELSEKNVSANRYR